MTVAIQRMIPGWLLVGVAVTLSLVCVVSLWNWAIATPELGYGDFIGYWSAVYLLHKGHSPYDPTAMMSVQETLIESNLDFTVMAWNPPSLLVLMLPLAWLPFQTARAAWLLVNLVIILFSCAILARMYLPSGVYPMLIFCLFAVAFPQVIVGISMGQVTFLVLLGLTTSMFFIRHGLWFGAGAALIFATVKPHMAILAVPYLLLYMAYKRKWQGWLGLFCAGIICSAVLFWLRPTWVHDFMSLSAIAPVNWATPTIGGLTSYLFSIDWPRYSVFLFLPLVLFLARRAATIDPEFAVGLCTIITVPTTFYGWSYDQSLLLIPMAQISGWWFRSRASLTKTVLAIWMVVAIVLNFVHRIFAKDELYFLWVPLVWAIIYGLAWHLLSKSTSLDGLSS